MREKVCARDKKEANEVGDRQNETFSERKKEKGARQPKQVKRKRQKRMLKSAFAVVYFECWQVLALLILPHRPLADGGKRRN